MFRCRSDNICIHPHNVCDGVVQCRYSLDDEALCETQDQFLICPYYCTCTGLTATCNSTKEKRPHHQYSLHGLLVEQTRVDLYELLYSCTSLLILHIENSNVSTSDLNAINNNVMLHRLTLKANKLNVIPKHSLNKLKHLQTLEIYQNFLPVLMSYAFGGLHNLHIVNVSGLGIRRLEDCCFCEMATLREIDLSNNSISTLRIGMLLTTNPFDTIDLTHNNITYIQPIYYLAYFKAAHFSNLVYYCFLLPGNATLVSRGSISSYSCDQILPDDGSLSVHISLALLLLIVITSVVIPYLSSASKHIFTLHFAMADITYVFYMFVIAAAHLYYQEQLPLHHQQWVSSRTCQISMMLFIVTMCQNRCLTFFINVNYLQGTVFAMTSRPFNKREKYYILITLWVIVVCFSTVFSVFTVNTSLLCVPSTQLNVQLHKYISIIGYIMHILLSLINILFTLFTYLSIIKCIQTSARELEKGDDYRSKIRLIFTKCLIIIISSALSDCFLVALPIMDTKVFRNIELYIILLVFPQKILADLFVYTGLNQIRAQLKKFR